MQKEYIVIHHSATKDGIVFRDYDSIEQSHLARGYKKIGYHEVIELINGVLTATPGRSENEEAAACPGKNFDAIHICVVGNFEIEIPTQELYQFVADECKDYITRHPIKEIGRHRDYYATLCPGKNFNIEKVKQLVYQKEEPPLKEVKVNVGNSEVIGLLINDTTYVPIRPYNEAVTKTLKEAVDEVVWRGETRTVEVK